MSNTTDRINGTGAKQSPEEIEHEIELKREELAATVTELQARFDVKSRAAGKAAELKDRATTDAGQPRPGVIAAALGVAAVIGLVVWRARRDG